MSFRGSLLKSFMEKSLFRFERLGFFLFFSEVSMPSAEHAGAHPLGEGIFVCTDFRVCCVSGTGSDFISCQCGIDLFSPKRSGVAGVASAGARPPAPPSLISFQFLEFFQKDLTKPLF